VDRTQTRKKTNPVKVNFLVDLAIFAAFLALLEPHTTGMAIHEWLGIAFGAAAVTHLVLHWKWLVATTRRILGKLPRQSRVSYLLNTLLFAAMTILIFSGLMISEVALPALGLNLSPGFTWRALHTQMSDVVLILLGLHVALHWKWIVTTTRRYVVAPVAARLSRRPAPAVPALAEVSVEEVGA
jgi:hypothetical protein